jgi:hypothetical protein
MPPKPESVMPKRFLPGIRVGWGSGVWGKTRADMNICNQLPSTTCVHVSQSNIAQVFRMSNGVGGGFVVVVGKGVGWIFGAEILSPQAGLFF